MPFYGDRVRLPALKGLRGPGGGETLGKAVMEAYLIAADDLSEAFGGLEKGEHTLRPDGGDCAQADVKGLRGAARRTDGADDGGRERGR